MPKRRLHRLLCLLAMLALAGTGCTSTLPPSEDELPALPPSHPVQGTSAVAYLLASTSATVFSAFLDAGNKVGDVFTQIGDVISRSNGNTPLKAARAMDNPDFPDARIQGINDLVNQYEFAHHPPYTIRYAELAEKDPDYLVRATAIRALNISHDKTATPIFIAALEDTNEPVRLEACKALNNLPDEKAIPSLLRRLEGHRETIVDGRPQDAEEDADVRIAAAQALRRYPKLEVATALVSYLNERNFAVAWQSHRSLEQMTNSDWNYDEAAWLRYLSGPKKPLAS